MNFVINQTKFKNNCSATWPISAVVMFKIKYLPLQNRGVRKINYSALSNKVNANFANLPKYAVSIARCHKNNAITPFVIKILRAAVWWATTLMCFPPTAPKQLGMFHFSQYLSMIFSQSRFEGALRYIGCNTIQIVEQVSNVIFLTVSTPS